MWKPEYDFLNYSKVLNVKSPVRANYGDAGIDFFVPNWSQEFQELFLAKNAISTLSQTEISVPPQGSVLIPSGIKINVPEGWALVAFSKSGVATKKGFIPGASVCDSGYEGMLHLSLINSTTTFQKIALGEKIIQFIMLPIGSQVPREVPEDQLFLVRSDRGEGGFGSSGIA